MRRGGPSILFALWLELPNAQAQSSVRSCPIAAMAAPIRYERLHQIPIAADPDDVSHKIVTPGGMALDAPKMIAATDVLTVVARDSNTLCFTLRTFARDRDTCELTGVARRHSAGAYLFDDESALVRFTFTGEDQVRVEPHGTAHRSRCKSSGKIDGAIYSLNPKPPDIR